MSNRWASLFGEENDGVGTLSVDPRERALTAIAEVLGEGTRVREGRGERSSKLAQRPKVAYRPRASTLPGPRAPARTRRRSRRRAWGRSWVAGMALAVALALGAVVGSGVFNSQARYNSERLAAQEQAIELYGVPDVQGHPGGAREAGQASSVRRFLALAQIF